MNGKGNGLVKAVVWLIPPQVNNNDKGDDEKSMYSMIDAFTLIFQTRPSQSAEGPRNFEAGGQQALINEHVTSLPFLALGLE